MFGGVYLLKFSILQGIPESAEVAVPVAHFPGNQATSGNNPISETVIAAPASGAPNSSPLNMFPQVYIFFGIGYQ